MDSEDGASSAAGGVADHEKDGKTKQQDLDALCGKIIHGAKAKLAESGEKARLKMLLRQRLEAAGWGEEMQDYLQEVIRNKSLQHVAIPDVVGDVAPRSQAAIPDMIKKEISDHISEFLTGAGGAGN